MAWTEHYVTTGGTDTYANSTNSGTPCSLATAIAGAAAGDRINVKAGTYNSAGSLSFATAGSATAPIWWRGYKTTIGDLDAAGGSRIPSTDLPLFSMGNSGHQITSGGAGQIFSNIAVTSIATGSGGAWSSSGNNRFIRCQFESTVANSNGRAFTSNATNILVGCLLKATTTATYVISFGAATNLIGCNVVGGAIGVSAGEPGTIDYTVVSGFATSGIVMSTASRNYSVNNCTIYAAATNGILISAGLTGFCSIANTIIGGCTNGVNNSSGANINTVLLLSNQFYACTNNIVNLTEQAGVTADLTAATFSIDNDTDPWVAKASANFNLASGVVAKSGGFPGIFDDPSGTTVMTGYPDIGAVRHVDPAAGGGGETSHTFIS